MNNANIDDVSVDQSVTEDKEKMTEDQKEKAADVEYDAKEESDAIDKEILDPEELDMGDEEAIIENRDD